jgi:hypothetical protein
MPICKKIFLTERLIWPWQLFVETDSNLKVVYKHVKEPVEEKSPHL